MTQPTILTEGKTTAGIAFDTDLDSALLIAESEDGGYQPVSAVSTINEAIEIAEADFERQKEELDRGEEPTCPARYVVWARGFDGAYRNVHEFEPK